MTQISQPGTAHYIPLLSWTARITAALTFLNLIAGSLVTGYKAALADPTWPSFVGNWYPMYWVGGLMYEDGHRVIGMVLGLATIAMTTFLVIKDPRSWVRSLAWASLALVIIQGIIGGMVIKTYRNLFVSMLHASTAQLFFCVVIALALATSRGWFQLEPFRQLARKMGQEMEAGYADLHLVKKLSTLCAGLTILQVILGSGVRHGDRAHDDHDIFFWVFLVLHIVNWMVILFTAGALQARIRNLQRAGDPLRGPGIAASSLVFIQLLLGAGSFVANRARLEAGVPIPWHVAVSSAHLAIGGLILVTFLIMAMRARYICRAGESA